MKLLAPLILMTAAIALGGPITFTFTGTASGSLGAFSFTGAAYTATATADTTTVSLTSSSPATYGVTAISATVNIAGLPVATITDPIQVSVVQPAEDIEFTDRTLNKTLVFINKLFVGLDTYTLQTSFGPINYSGPDIGSQLSFPQDVPTNQGNLSWKTSNDTFTATTPEPASCGLLFAGFMTLAVNLVRLRASSSEASAGRNH